MNEVADPNVGGTIAQWMTGAVGAGVALALTIQKLLKSWSADRVERVSADAQGDVVRGLTTEITRLQRQNTALAEQLNRIQLDMAKLVSENYRLQGEIESFHVRLDSHLRSVNGAVTGNQP